jgi:hypothetical protein
MLEKHLIEWLFTNSGPILRCRIAVDLMDASSRERERLYQESLATPEVHRWLDNLDQARNIHGSRDTDVENSLAKLLAYGFGRELDKLDRKVQQILGEPRKIWEPLVLCPYLVQAGYSSHPLVNAWFTERIEMLYQTARTGSYDFYLTVDEARKVPKAWQGKPIYRDEYGHQAGYALPTCFDLYALAFRPSASPIADLDLKCETIAVYLSDPHFQSTPGGYGWDKQKRQCYAAGRVFLACVEPWRLVLFLELGAHFKAAIRSGWFRQGMEILEGYRTETGTYCFPARLLQEKVGNHIYGGSHMGMGENRRSRLALELESTFHMLIIQKNIQTHAFA